MREIPEYNKNLFEEVAEVDDAFQLAVNLDAADVQKAKEIIGRTCLNLTDAELEAGIDVPVDALLVWMGKDPRVVKVVFGRFEVDPDTVHLEESAVILTLSFNPKDGGYQKRLKALPPPEYLTSQELCARLATMEDKPWGEYRRTGRPITPHALARMLAAFDIHPQNIRLADGRIVKGYRRDQFADSWARYL